MASWLKLVWALWWLWWWSPKTIFHSTPKISGLVFQVKKRQDRSVLKKQRVHFWCPAQRWLGPNPHWTRRRNTSKWNLLLWMWMGECSHCTQTTSKELHTYLRAGVQCGLEDGQTWTTRGPTNPPEPPSQRIAVSGRLRSGVSVFVPFTPKPPPPPVQFQKKNPRPLRKVSIQEKNDWGWLKVRQWTNDRKRIELIWTQNSQFWPKLVALFLVWPWLCSNVFCTSGRDKRTRGPLDSDVTMQWGGNAYLWRTLQHTVKVETQIRSVWSVPYWAPSAHSSWITVKLQARITCLDFR